VFAHIAKSIMADGMRVADPLLPLGHRGLGL
jgi:hypothetical protein